MQRVKRSTAVAVLPNPPEGGTPGYFAAPNPQGGIDATVPGYEWFNAVQEEICAVIEAAGIALDEGDRTQLVAALIKTGMQGSHFSIATAAGTADAITAVFTPAIAALTHGMTLHVRAAAANATTAPTFTPAAGTIAAKTIVKGNNLQLAAGDIAGAGHWLTFSFDQTLDKWVLQNPATGINTTMGAGYMLVKDEKASGVDGGGTTAGTTYTRTLNTVSANTISGASLSSNQITLPAGTYRINATAPCGANPHQAWLYNVTSSSIQLRGTSENATVGGSADQVVTHSEIRGRFTLAAPAVFELRHYVSATHATVGLGAATGQGGEVYSMLEVIKEA